MIYKSKINLLSLLDNYSSLLFFPITLIFSLTKYKNLIKLASYMKKYNNILQKLRKQYINLKKLKKFGYFFNSINIWNYSIEINISYIKKYKYKILNFLSNKLNSKLYSDIAFCTTFCLNINNIDKFMNIKKKYFSYTDIDTEEKIYTINEIELLLPRRLILNPGNPINIEPIHKLHSSDII
jgi:hypothetical protein